MITRRPRDAVVRAARVCHLGSLAIAFGFTSNSNYRRGTVEQRTEGPCGSINLRRGSGAPKFKPRVSQT